MRISDWSSDVCSSDLINIVLDLVFVLAFGWGVAGVAWATLIAESTAAAAGLTLILWRVGRPHAADWLRLKEPARLAALIRGQPHIFLRTLLLVLISEEGRVGKKQGITVSIRWWQLHLN